MTRPDYFIISQLDLNFELLNPVIKFWYETQINYLGFCGIFCAHVKYFDAFLHFRYKENPNIANESVHAQAREALKKYLHYFERVSL